MTTNYAYVDTEGKVITTALPPDDPAVKDLTFLPAVAATVEKPPIMELGMCMVCRRWRQYGEPCFKCGSDKLDLRQVIVQELKAEFAELVLVTQDLLFDEVPEVKAYANPLWWANCTAPQLRQAVVTLRGIAATNGIPLPGRTQEAVSRQTVVKNIDGEEWVCLETPAGLTQLRRVESVGKDFRCQHCGREFDVRIAWFRHENACDKKGR